MKDNKCLKCGGSEFEEGLHRIGPAKKVFSTGMTWYGGYKNAKELISYRCKQCGFIESYAK